MGEAKPCRTKTDWGSLENNKWLFEKLYITKSKFYLCEYRAILTDDNQNYYHSAWIKLTHGMTITDEVIEVRCKSFSNPTRSEYESLFVQIVDKQDKLEKKRIDQKKSGKKSCKPLDIMLISYDSVSRVAWLKRLPKTNKYMFSKMKFDLLDGYNILGDGTPGKAL